MIDAPPVRGEPPRSCSELNSQHVSSHIRDCPTYERRGESVHGEGFQVDGAFVARLQLAADVIPENSGENVSIASLTNKSALALSTHLTTNCLWTNVLISNVNTSFYYIILHFFFLNILQHLILSCSFNLEVNELMDKITAQPHFGFSNMWSDVSCCCGVWFHFHLRLHLGCTT